LQREIKFHNTIYHHEGLGPIVRRRWPTLTAAAGPASRSTRREGYAFLAELHAIHALREGNGRTQPTFFSLPADMAGYPGATKTLAWRLGAITSECSALQHHSKCCKCRNPRATGAYSMRR